MLKRIIVLLFFVQVSFGQTKEGIEICLAAQKYANSFITDKEAENALDKILSVIGASKNFTLQPCDEISNALAITYNGNRYILYDKKFMQLIAQYTNNWSNIFILAHEVGHHINGHTRDAALAGVLSDSSLEKQRQEELEADKFAGFVLAKLGASLNQTVAAVDLLSPTTDDAYSTHPNKNKRLESIRIGYSNGSSNIRVNSVTVNVKRDERIRSGYSAWERVEQNFENPFEKAKIEAYTFGEIKPYKSTNLDIKPRFSITKSEYGNYSGKLSNINLKIKNFLINNDPSSSLKLKAMEYVKSNMNGFNFSEWEVPTNFRNGYVYHSGDRISFRAQFLFDDKVSNYINKNNKEYVSNGRGVGSGGYYRDSGDPPPKIGNDGILNELTFPISKEFLENLKKYPKVYFRVEYFSQRAFMGLDNGSITDNYKIFWFDILPSNKKEYIEFDLTGSSKALSF